MNKAKLYTLFALVYFFIFSYHKYVRVVQLGKPVIMFWSALSLRFFMPLLTVTVIVFEQWYLQQILKVHA